MNLNAPEAVWLIDDPILLDGEVAFVRFGQLVNMKLGDGRKFSETPYNFDFGDGSGNGSVPTGQVTRYRQFISANAEISIKGLFNEKNSLADIYLFRKSPDNFSIKVGTTSGGSELGTYQIKKNTTALNIVELFEVDTDLYISGFTISNVCNIRVLYNSFQVNSDGSVPTDIIQDLRDEMAADKEYLESIIQALENSMMQIPSGIIVPWPLPIDQIPPGWSLYTGFKDLFLVGAGGKYQLNDSGGQDKVKLTIGQLPKHRFTYRMPKGEGSATGNRDSHPDGPLQDGFTNYIGNDEEHENRPPFIAVNYIIKD